MAKCKLSLIINKRLQFKNCLNITMPFIETPFSLTLTAVTRLRMLFVDGNLFKGGFAHLNESAVLITFSVNCILLTSSCFVHGLFSVHTIHRIK